MYILKNLPVFLPLTVSVILSIMGIYYKADFNEILLKLVFAIVIFYFLGIFIRDTILGFLFRVLEESERKARVLRDIELEKHKENRRPLILEDANFEPYEPQKVKVNN